MDYRQAVLDADQAGKLSGDAKDNLLLWLEKPLFARYKDELHARIENGEWEYLDEGFFQVLPFGTGGRRGEVGLGPNRLNEVTIAQSAQGVANALKKEVKDRAPKVAVAYDTRLTSPRFTESVARVLAANGIEVYLFDGPRATPQLSFTIGDLGLDAGIVVSASHNPPQDNGFKAYWSDGGQVVPPRDAALIEEVKNVESVEEISFAEAAARGLIQRLNDTHDARYRDAVIAQMMSDAREVRIVYSALHGTGITSIYPMLRRAGFTDVHLVESQKDPDGRFPNVPKHQPNPEITSGLDAAIELARAVKADIAMASDPDADRLACAVPDKNGEFVLLSGNQCAAIMMEHIGSHLEKLGKLESRYRVYSTCVSSPLMPSIARAYGLTVKNDLLVGFKWIAEQIALLDDPNDFLFGSEESIGFMKGPQTRDKDGAIAALLMAEISAELKARGSDVLTYLDEIYKKYGYFSDAGISVFLEGTAGKDRMGRIMSTLRDNPPQAIADAPIVSIVDREKNAVLDMNGEQIEAVDGPPSNLLIFHLNEDRKSWIAIRPSGTEPKIKFYFSLATEVQGELSEVKTRQADRLETLKTAVKELALSIE